MAEVNPPIRCLIVSPEAPPVSEESLVEGGGIRSWGLAQGIKANAPEIEVTLAFHARHAAPDSCFAEQAGVRLAVWTSSSLAELVASAHTIVVRYEATEAVLGIAECIRPDQQLILDCYIPIYLEVSARGASDLQGEYLNYVHDVERWARILRRGDFFLTASSEQERFYEGVLSAIGRLNPATYGREMMIRCPFGVFPEGEPSPRRPLTELVSHGAMKVLWFGGAYPWFEFGELIEGISLVRAKGTEVELVIVGAHNPFDKPTEFTRAAERLVDEVEAGPHSTYVHFVDWVPYRERTAWYRDADVIITINSSGPENRLAWRTRLADYLAVPATILTNGGDPLGLFLAGRGAAATLPGTDAESIATGLLELLNDSRRRELLAAAVREVAEELSWTRVTARLAALIRRQERAADFATFGVEMAGPGPMIQSSGLRSLPRRVMAYYRRFGLWAVVRASVDAARFQYDERRTRLRASPQVIAIAHQLDLTGAPLVLVDLLHEMTAISPAGSIEVFTRDPVESPVVHALNAAGLVPRRLPTADRGLRFRPGDVALLNTASHGPALRDSVFRALETGVLRRCVWYIHEDTPERWFDQSEVPRVSHLLGSGKLFIFVPSSACLESYRTFFGSGGVHLQTYRLPLPERHGHVRPPEDFHTLRFVLPGRMDDTRKGQLALLYALSEIAHRLLRTGSERYREFSIEFIGLGRDVMSEWFRVHGESALGRRLILKPVLTREETLERISASNMTICYSLSESFAIFVYEGMFAGHPILRNDSPGQAEQLVEGVNGFGLKMGDYRHLVETLERTLDRQQTTDEQLAEMSAASHRMATRMMAQSYGPLLEKLLG